MHFPLVLVRLLWYEHLLHQKEEIYGLIYKEEIVQAGSRESFVFRIQ